MKIEFTIDTDELGDVVVTLEKGDEFDRLLIATQGTVTIDGNSWAEDTPASTEADLGVHTVRSTATVPKPRTFDDPLNKECGLCREGHVHPNCLVHRVGRSPG